VAIGGIGILKTPLKLIVKKGKICKVDSTDLKVLTKVKSSLQTDEMASVVGEFAFGINSKARFIEEFLESEKVLGTVHIAFGDNSDFPGGKNDSGNHIDFLMSKPTVKMVTDAGNSVIILKNGKFSLKGIAR